MCRLLEEVALVLIQLGILPIYCYVVDIKLGLRHAEYRRTKC